MCYGLNSRKVRLGATISLQCDKYVTKNLYKFLDTEPKYVVKHILHYTKLLV